VAQISALAVPRPSWQQQRPPALPPSTETHKPHGRPEPSSSIATSLHWKCDVTDCTALLEALDHAEQLLGPVTGLVTPLAATRAAWFISSRPRPGTRSSKSISREKYRADRAGTHGRAPTRGAVVLCSSPAVFVGFAAGGASTYAASKEGVGALMRSESVGYTRHGIRVNALVPGSTQTPLTWASVPERERDRMRSALQHEIPLGRLADREDPAKRPCGYWDPTPLTSPRPTLCDGGVPAKASISF
jgi:NAD(P)-dependent dehydrogenase (short-subunit alcohol dehydrogenase family)